MPSLALSDAAAYLSSAPSLAKVPNATKLEVEQLYGLYKYLTVAPAPQNARPSLFDIAGRAKWDAWNNTGKKYAKHDAEAEKRYLEIARELGWEPGAGVGPRDEGEVWDEDLGVNIPLSSTAGKGGLGGSVSAMAAPGDDDAAGHALHRSAIQGDANQIARLLTDNALVDIDQRDEYGYTALHLACDRGNLPAVKVLIKHGADATTKDPDDLTAPELAQIAGHDAICAFLQTELH